MNYSTFRFTLDIQSDISQVSLPVKLNDTGRQLLIGLTDGGNPYHISEGSMALFSYKKNEPNQDGVYESGLFDCIIEDNYHTIRFDLLPDVTSVAGVVDCEIWLYGPNGRQLASPRFIIVVDERVMASKNYPMSDENLSLIESVIVSEARRVEAETKRVEAEIAREEASSEAVRKAEDATRNANASLARLDYAQNTKFVDMSYSFDGKNWSIKASQTYSEIDQAVKAKMMVVAVFGNRYFYYNGTNADGIVLTAHDKGAYETMTVFTLVISPSNEVTSSSHSILTKSGVTKIVNIQDTDDGYKADATVAEILSAHNAGTPVIAKWYEGVFHLTIANESEVRFTNSYATDDEHIGLWEFALWVEDDGNEHVELIEQSVYTGNNASFPAPAGNPAKKITESGYYYIYVYKTSLGYMRESFGVHYFSTTGMTQYYYAGTLRIQIVGNTGTINVFQASQTVSDSGKVATTYTDVTADYTICTAKVG